MLKRGECSERTNVFSRASMARKKRGGGGDEVGKRMVIITFWKGGKMRRKR